MFSLVVVVGIISWNKVEFEVFASTTEFHMNNSESKNDRTILVNHTDKAVTQNIVCINSFLGKFDYNNIARPHRWVALKTASWSSKYQPFCSIWSMIGENIWGKNNLGLISRLWQFQCIVFLTCCVTYWTSCCLKESHTTSRTGAVHVLLLYLVAPNVYSYRLNVILFCSVRVQVVTHRKERKGKVM